MKNIKYCVGFLMCVSMAYANAPLSTAYLGIDYLAMNYNNLFEGNAAGCFRKVVAENSPG